MALKKTYTIGDSVYEQLLEEILTLQYLPGEKLSEILLAEKYGVSRAPVRNALGRLEQDGLVRIKPQSGTIVSEISIQKARAPFAKENPEAAGKLPSYEAAAFFL